MKKRPAIGLVVGVLVLAVVFGIASIPDDVLVESSEIESAQPMAGDTPSVGALAESQKFIANAVTEKNIDAAKAELDALKQEMSKLKNELVELKSEPQIPDETPKTIPVQDKPPKEDSQVTSGGKVIKVNIKDGVGSKSR